jgi:hypothetical protein
MNKNPGPGKSGKRGNQVTQSGPKRDTSWKKIFQDLLTIKDVRLPEGTLISRKKAIAMKVVHLALAGDISAANFIAKYTEPSEPLKSSKSTRTDAPPHQWYLSYRNKP